MGNDYAAFTGGWVDVPGEVLFDGDGEAGVESALDAVVPLALVGVAVVRVEYGLIVVQKIQVRFLRERESGR